MALDQQIYNIAITEGFTPTTAKLIVAQARLESGHYGSDVFKANNNMYGMKFVGQPLATRGSLAPVSERSKKKFVRIQTIMQSTNHPKIVQGIPYKGCIKKPCVVLHLSN